MYVTDALCLCHRRLQGPMACAATCDVSSTGIYLPSCKLCCHALQFVGFFCSEQSQRDSYAVGGVALNKAPY